jgi:hypothetical protein
MLFRSIAFLMGCEEELAGYIAMMSPERQEAFEIELAQRQARLLLQSRQQMDVLGKQEERDLEEKIKGERVIMEVMKVGLPRQTEESSEESSELSDFDGESFMLEILCRPLYPVL